MKKKIMNNYPDPFLNLDDDNNEDIETTCLVCGFTENVPDFIYDEMSRKKYHFKINKKVSTLTCQKCGKESAVPSTWIKK